MSAALLTELNAFRVAAGLAPLKTWKKSRNEPELEIYREDARREAMSTSFEVDPAPTFDLTDNEFHAAMILVNDCLAGMGGQRPADLGHDEYTWIDIDSLVAHGWSKEEAAGTFSALSDKGVISEYEKGQMVLNTSAWRWLDTKWNENIALASTSKIRTNGAPKPVPAAKPAPAAKAAKVDMPTQNDIKRPRPGGLCADAWAMFDSLGRGVVIADALKKAQELKLNPNNIRTELCRWRKFNGISMK